MDKYPGGEPVPNVGEVLIISNDQERPLELEAPKDTPPAEFASPPEVLVLAAETAGWNGEDNDKDPVPLSRENGVDQADIGLRGVCKFEPGARTGYAVLSAGTMPGSEEEVDFSRVGLESATEYLDKAFAGPMSPEEAGLKLLHLEFSVEKKIEGLGSQPYGVHLSAMVLFQDVSGKSYIGVMAKSADPVAHAHAGNINNINEAIRGDALYAFDSRCRVRQDMVIPLDSSDGDTHHRLVMDSAALRIVSATRYSPVRSMCDHPDFQQALTSTDHDAQSAAKQIADIPYKDVFEAERKEDGPIPSSAGRITYVIDLEVSPAQTQPEGSGLNGAAEVSEADAPAESSSAVSAEAPPDDPPADILVASSEGADADALLVSGGKGDKPPQDNPDDPIPIAHQVRSYGRNEKGWMRKGIKEALLSDKLRKVGRGVMRYAVYSPFVAGQNWRWEAMSAEEYKFSSKGRKVAAAAAGMAKYALLAGAGYVLAKGMPDMHMPHLDFNPFNNSGDHPKPKPTSTQKSPQHHAPAQPQPSETPHQGKTPPPTHEGNPPKQTPPSGDPQPPDHPVAKKAHVAERAWVDSPDSQRLHIIPKDNGDVIISTKGMRHQPDDAVLSIHGQRRLIPLDADGETVVKHGTQIASVMHKGSFSTVEASQYDAHTGTLTTYATEVGTGNAHALTDFSLTHATTHTSDPITSTLGHAAAMPGAGHHGVLATAAESPATAPFTPFGSHIGAVAGHRVLDSTVGLRPEIQDMLHRIAQDEENDLAAA